MKPMAAETLRGIFSRTIMRMAKAMASLYPDQPEGLRPAPRDSSTPSKIPPSAAPRGLPQIEVTFDIDANGIVHVSAKDLGTGKEQSIRITASSGLAEEEIKKMVKDAEAHAAEDKKRREGVEARNQLDTLIYTTEKSLAEYGDKIDAGDKQTIEEAIAKGQPSGVVGDTALYDYYFRRAGGGLAVGAAANVAKAVPTRSVRSR